MLGTAIPVPKFRSSEIHVVTSILKKTVFIPFQVFSGKISSETEHFRASRNQIFSSPPTMVGSGIRQLRELCMPEPTITHKIFETTSIFQVK